MRAKRVGLRVISQKNSWDCGVAALAMLLDKPYGDVAAVCRRIWGTTMPSRRGLGLYHLEILACEFNVSLARIYKQPGYLEGRSGILGVNGGEMCWAGHLVVLKGGAIVDPDDGRVWTVDDYLAKHKARTGTLLVRAEGAWRVTQHSRSY